MNEIDIRNRVCPVENAGGLDNSFRRFLQNPRKILSPYINDGMTVLDFGCGPGYFSIDIAKLLGNSGKVISADLQEGMLNIVEKKIKGTDLENKVQLHKCSEDRIGVTETVDFILAFYVVHEVPDKGKLFKEFKSILKPNGKLLIVEPLFHVPKKSFDNMTEELKSLGFEITDKPKVFFSRAVLLSNLCVME